MASIGHVAVGLLIGRAYEARSPRERAVALVSFGALALLPDADVVGTLFGADYHGTYGHRGYSHSLLFAATFAGAAYAVARKWGTRPWFTALLAFLAVSSHGILDAMTYRTVGVPMLWPFSEVRFTLPWRHIPPAPASDNLFSQRGLEVAAVEMVYFLPITLASFLPARATLRRWANRLAFWSPIALRPAAALAPAPARRGHLAALGRAASVVAVVALSMTFAKFYLRDSKVVSWIERSTEQGVAVSVMTLPQYRHYH